MNIEYVEYQNTKIIKDIRAICLGVTTTVTKDTEGLVDGNVKTAADLNNSIMLINNTIDHELTRRYGA